MTIPLPNTFTPEHFNRVSRKIYRILDKEDPQIVLAVLGYVITRLFHEIYRTSEGQWDVEGFSNTFCTSIQKSVSTVILRQKEH